MYYYLAYFSSAAKELTGKELQNILETSRRNNERLEVTGMLLYSDGNILQVIEGDERIIHNLFDTISQDNRHMGILKILEGEMEERNFPGWSMGFNSVSLKQLAKEPGFKNFSGSDFISSITNSTHPAVELLKSFYKDYKRYNSRD